MDCLFRIRGHLNTKLHFFVFQIKELHLGVELYSQENNTLTNVNNRRGLSLSTLQLPFIFPKLWKTTCFENSSIIKTCLPSMKAAGIIAIRLVRSAHLTCPSAFPLGIIGASSQMGFAHPNFSLNYSSRILGVRHGAPLCFS